MLSTIILIDPNRGPHGQGGLEPKQESTCFGQAFNLRFGTLAKAGPKIYVGLRYGLGFESVAESPKPGPTQIRYTI